MIRIRPLCRLLIILSAPLYVCGKKMDAKPVKPATVLIFNHIPAYPRITHPFPRFAFHDNRPQIAIFDLFHEYDLNPQTSKADTVILFPQNDHIILQFVYCRTRDPLNYVIDQGDTITFTFVNGVPYAENKNASKNGYLNYDYGRLLATQNSNKAKAYQIYKSPDLVAQDINEVINNRRQVRKDYYNRARDFLDAELIFLNNFKELREISPGTFDFFRDKLTYQIARLDFEQHMLSADTLNAILYRKKKSPANLSYSYFLPFLEAVADSVILSKARFLKYKNGSDIDYRDVYDQTMKWSVINDFYKKQLLYKYLKEIGDGFSTGDLTRYLARFGSFSNDSTLVKNIKSHYCPTKIREKGG